MRVVTDREGHLGDQTVALLRHRDQELKWNIKLIDKASIKPDVDIFHQINGFWDKQPMEAQDKIFEVYKRIHITFDEIWETEDLARALLPQIAELCALHKLDDVRSWTSIEEFDFDTGEDFLSSPLVRDFLMRGWLEPLGDEGAHEEVLGAVARLIDEERHDGDFSLSIKATLVVGQKAR